MQLNCIIYMNEYEIDKNHDIQAKSDNKKLGKKWVKKIVIFCQLGFSSKIKVPQLGLARLGTFIARLDSSRKIPARAHHYHLVTYLI